MGASNLTLPARISPDGLVATWNPALTRGRTVILLVRGVSGETVARASLNSGRARVREGERIEAVRVPNE
ncbi:hypothetical protein BH20GEM2_BH20GEM2_16690 [soil metagenome]